MTRTRLERSLSAADHPILLETAAQLSDAKKSWNGKQVLGIDTEFVRERTYRAQLGLVQVSDGDTAWLVDPVRLAGLEPLKELLEDPGVTKVLHSGSEDLEVLLHSVGALPEPLVDTQIACAMLGQPLQMGYHATVQWLFGVEVGFANRPVPDRGRTGGFRGLAAHRFASSCKPARACLSTCLPRNTTASRQSCESGSKCRRIAVPASCSPRVTRGSAPRAWLQ